MKLSKLKEIIKILEESKIEEIEIKGIFTKVRVSKKIPVSGGDKTSADKNNLIQINKQETPIKPDQPKTQEKEEKFVFIKSPMIGTFYRAPSPKDLPYVEVGDKVTPEKIVCIIEAMKIFNEIKAGVSGTIVEILVKNEEHVEYGQPLFKVICQ